MFHVKHLDWHKQAVFPLQHQQKDRQQEKTSGDHPQTTGEPQLAAKAVQQLFVVHRLGLPALFGGLHGRTAGKNDGLTGLYGIFLHRLQAGLAKHLIVCSFFSATQAIHSHTSFCVCRYLSIFYYKNFRS